MNGYYFIILDHTALDPILSPIFPHLCKAMERIEKVKAEEAKAKDEASQTESEELRCLVVDCRRKNHP